jgi:hypothetical protein
VKRAVTVATAPGVGVSLTAGFGRGRTPPSWTNLRGEQKRVYEPITVEVDRAYDEGNYRLYTINFIGRLIQVVEAGHTTMRLHLPALHEGPEKPTISLLCP